MGQNHARIPRFVYGFVTVALALTPLVTAACGDSDSKKSPTTTTRRGGTTTTRSGATTTTHEATTTTKR